MDVWIILMRNILYIVIHTPGTFGNYLCYILDSHLKKEMLPSPFTSSGSAHARVNFNSNNLDLASPVAYKKYKELEKEKDYVDKPTEEKEAESSV